MSHDILDQVLTIVLQVAGPQRTPPNAGVDTPLAEDGFWLDSVALMEMIVALEERFDVVFDAETDVNAETLRTVRTVAEVISAKLNRSAPTGV